MPKYKFTSAEKKAYYLGLGVGLTGCGSSNSGQTRDAFTRMSDKEKISYLNGYERGQNNANLSAGFPLFKVNKKYPKKSTSPYDDFEYTSTGRIKGSYNANGRFEPD